MSEFHHEFSSIRRAFKAKTKRQFLRDLEGQIEEEEYVQSVLVKSRQRGQQKSRYVAVTFDRRFKRHFSYAYFDLVLVVLDAISGGNGIFKPSNQMRAMRWHSTRSSLVRVLRYFARNNPAIRFRRALVLPFPHPIAGYRVDINVHKK